MNPDAELNARLEALEATRQTATATLSARCPEVQEQSPRKGDSARSRLQPYPDAAGVQTINVPPVPQEVRETIAAYKCVRTGTHFECWLGDSGMVISTRFGSVPQLHLVQSAGGYRKQLTFDDEPAAHAGRSARSARG